MTLYKLDNITLFLNELTIFFLGSDTARFYVSAVGTMESINELRSILSVRPNLNLNKNCRQMSLLMATAVYEKLIQN